MRVISFVAIPLAVAAALAVACSSSDKGTGSGPTPTQVGKVAGDSQVANAGGPLGAPLSVVVTDASAAPVAGVTVHWAAASGGGSVSGPTSATGVDGIATITRTLGAGAGSQTTTATVTGLAGSPITFTSVAHIQGATQIALNGGNSQTDSVLATLATPISAIVKDEHSNPVAGVIVSWTFTGGGQVSQATDTTDGGGITSVTRTLGSVAGTVSTVATVTGLIGSPVSISATGTAGAAAQMALNGGNAQVGVKGTTLGVAHSVNVRDASGNPKAGVTVTWVVGIGGGSVSSPSPVTGANGIASVFRTLGDTVGTQTDTASVLGLSGTPVVFTATSGTAPVTAAVSVGPGGTLTFSPDSVVLANGGTVTWTWVTGDHGVGWLTAPGTLPADSPVQTSGTYMLTFNGVGVYTYDCLVHGTIMHGKIVVQ
jgi:adhesin/invasin